MKIGYKKSLGIKILETGEFTAASRNLQDEIMIKSIKETFNDQKDIFKPISIFSKNMQNVLLECGDKMLKDEIWNNVGSVNGTIILDDFMFCYFIKSNGTFLHDHVLYIFRGAEFIAYGWQNKEQDKSIVIVPETSKYLLEYSVPDNELMWQNTVFNGLYTTLIAAINFLKYADIEDKLIKAGSKEKGIDCKYFNATKTDVHYITSKYITNLFVKGAFKVRGHWRLQPKKKEGEWTKELIWINDFEKQGYTATAGKLKNND